MRGAAVAAVAAGLLAAGLGAAPAASANVEWLCRPGDQPNPCRESLETTVQGSDGSSRVENPPLPASPPIDCFYVYPTVSEQQGVNANKDKDPQQFAIARYQAARFSQRCRVYAPMYRQLTLLSINVATPEQRVAGGRLAYGDVREAWRDYLAHYNHGRGVVLIGHSQGTRMLRQLVREEVDPAPAVRRRLVSAVLLGGNVLVRKGRRAGGDFQNVPACTASGQVGCVIAFSTFNDTPPDNSRFGRSPASDTTGAGFPSGPNYEVLCTNPASLAANASRPLTSLLRSEPFPGVIGALLIETYGGPPPSASTPWLQPGERYTGRCETRAGANVLEIAPIGSARKLNAAPDPSWGLHLTDANIALGELVGEVAAGARSYLARSPRPCLARRAKIGPRGIGRIRLGRTRRQLVRTTGIEPVRRTRHSYRWCVKGSSRRVSAVFARRSGKARLVASGAYLRRFAHARRLGGGIFRAGKRSRRLFGVRRGRLRFVAVADRRLIRHRRGLRRAIRRAGL